VALETTTVETEPAASAAKVDQGAAPELGTTVALEMRVETRVDPLSGTSTDVVVREPEIEETASIRAAPMAGATSTSHGGLELLDDNLVDPAVVARNMESMCHAEQWIKVRCGYPK
jgi:hypothetical protein